MANMNVTYGDMENAASQLSTGENQLMDELRQLKSQVDALVSSGFVTDRASKQFQISYEEFTKGATITVQGLDGMINFLRKAQQSMADLDSQLASSLNS